MDRQGWGNLKVMSDGAQLAGIYIVRLKPDETKA